MSLFHVTFTKTWLPIHLRIHRRNPKKLFYWAIFSKKSRRKSSRVLPQNRYNKKPTILLEKRKKKVDFHIFAILRYLISLHIDIKSLELIFHHLFNNIKLSYFASDMKKKNLHKDPKCVVADLLYKVRLLNDVRLLDRVL